MSLDAICGVIALVQGIAYCTIAVVTGGFHGLWKRHPWWLRFTSMANGWFLATRGLDLLSLTAGGPGHVNMAALRSWVVSSTWALTYLAYMLTWTPNPFKRQADRLNGSR